MSTPQEPGRAPGSPALTALPRVEDLPQTSGGGYDADRVREAFDAFRRHSAQLQAQLRVLQAAGRSADVEPTGHAVRMDALHLIRAASEFADTIERDAQQASANQLARTEGEVSARQHQLQDREREIERYRQESERQRAEILNAARNESRELLQSSQRDASQEVREAESRANRLVEQARHQATELTNAARAEVEQTLEWARAQASTIMARAQQGAEQLLGSAGLGEDQIGRVAEAIVKSAEQPADTARKPGSLLRDAESPSGAAQAPEEPTATPPLSVTPPAAPPVSPAPSATSADDDEPEEPQA